MDVPTTQDTEPNTVTQDAASQAPTQASKPKASAGKGKIWIIAVAIGIVLAIVAWIFLAINEYVSFWSAAGAFVSALVGAIMVGKGLWRDLSITATVAAGALLVVYGIFYFGIEFAINSI